MPGMYSNRDFKAEEEAYHDYLVARSDELDTAEDKLEELTAMKMRLLNHYYNISRHTAEAMSIRAILGFIPEEK